MKKINLLFLLSFLVPFSAKSQDTIERAKNPFTEARYHYFLKTIILFNEYLDTDNGSYNTTQLRFLHPIANKAWNLRVDIPLISANTTAENKTGIGDIDVGISYIPYLERSNGIAFRAKIVSNSASDPAFGTGKWVFIPSLFYGRYIKKKQYLWIVSLEQQNSFAGHSDRSDINTTAFENLVLMFLGKNWIGADVAFRYNHTIDGYQNNAFVEFGRKITPNNMLYIHPSAGFGKDRSYNYGLEVGVLILF